MNGVLLEPIEDGKTPAEFNYIWNPLFNDYYSKTINVHSDDRRQGFERTLHFCSVECLQEYNRHL